MISGPKKSKATIGLKASPGSILDFEDFLGGLEFVSPPDRDRISIAGGEILDNIVKHASPLEGGRIIARVAKSKGSILLSFYFRSPSFAAFASNGAAAAAEPLFDPAHRRWRGMGLVMCRNIARRLSFRPGSLRDRIYLEFSLHEN